MIKITIINGDITNVTSDSFSKMEEQLQLLKQIKKLKQVFRVGLRQSLVFTPHPPTRTHTRTCAHVVRVREIDVSELFRFRLFVAKQGTKAKIRVMKFKDKLVAARGHTLCAKPAKFSYLSSSRSLVTRARLGKKIFESVSQSASITWSVSISQSVSVSQIVIL